MELTRVLRRLGPSFGNRKFVFAILAVSLLSVKSVRIFTRIHVLSGVDLVCWAALFYAQDILLLLFARYLFGRLCTNSRRPPALATAATLVVIGVLLGMAVATDGFFVVTGSEMHWRNIGLISDTAAMKMMVKAGSWTCLAVFVTIILLSWFIQDVCYSLWGAVVIVITRTLLSPLRGLSMRWLNIRYNRIFLHDEPKDEIEYSLLINEGFEPSSSEPTRAPRLILGLIFGAQLVLTLMHPFNSSLGALVWTLPFVPLVDFTHFGSGSGGLKSVKVTIVDGQYQNHTAVSQPPDFPWLPSETRLAGFDDWYDEGGEHYNMASDPFGISNLYDDIIPELTRSLRSIKIRHVMMVILESTRSDVFPINKDGYIWNTVAESFPNKTMPTEWEQKLSTLTPTANYITGDYDDGFEHAQSPARGGIRATNAFTTGTYTLKSLAGTLCGVTPLAAPFGVEFSHHIYQPCMPHVFDAFNVLLDESGTEPGDDFTTFKWKSSFMQSVTDTFDQQDLLMPVLGYDYDNGVITEEYLKGENAKFGYVDVPDINYFGMPEVVLEDYIRDAFVMANENSERVFLTHLTSTTHHPFDIPDSEDGTIYVVTEEDGSQDDGSFETESGYESEEEVVGQADGDDNRHDGDEFEGESGGDGEAEAENLKKRDSEELSDLSKYLISVGYVDKWIGKILGILDEQGVADETLVIFLGDHGLSIAENEAITAYDNPNIANFHIPLILSHPGLPKLDIHDAVLSLQILPTILDLLLETGSLADAQVDAARDVMWNYEGQSLLRPLKSVSEDTGLPNWQFTITNPGDSMIAVRDARQPGWRLVIPLLDGFEWRFSDADKDPQEEVPVLAVDMVGLMAKVEEDYGAEQSRWVEEAVAVTEWWMKENHRRYRYDT
ncbi:sulfatase domain protein [Xylariales sp. PMI_506]|nr:sulfatase domain protein [Xylariales sp. PMI_506]